MPSPSEIARADEACPCCQGEQRIPAYPGGAAIVQCPVCGAQASDLAAECRRLERIAENAVRLQVEAVAELQRQRQHNAALADRLASASGALSQAAAKWDVHPQTVALRAERSILDAAWGMFLFFLTFKAASAGKLAVAVDPRRTSQECPFCGAIQSKNLSERRHECPCRPGSIDRDFASALVIEALALGVAGATRLRRERPLVAVMRPPPSRPVETDSPASTRC